MPKIKNMPLKTGIIFISFPFILASSFFKSERIYFRKNNLFFDKNRYPDLSKPNINYYQSHRVFKIKHGLQVLRGKL
jgi:hypothetical protein